MMLTLNHVVDMNPLTKYEDGLVGSKPQLLQHSQVK